MKPNKQIKKLLKSRYKKLIEQINNKILVINKAECEGIDFDILRPYYNKVTTNQEKIIFWRV